MIDLYTWNTPNGRKVSIALEEMQLAYKVHSINIMEDEQFQPHFLAIAPNNRIPAIVDNDTGLSLFESGAILQYLAEKTGKFWAAEGEAHWKVTQWLMWQMGGLGPMAGQANHFLSFNKGKSDYADERYGNETKRLYRVLNEQLGKSDFVAGDYSIADMAIFPWVAGFEYHHIDLSDYAHVKKWYREIAARPAVAVGYAVPDITAKIPQV